MNEKILVPVDGSEAAAAAVIFAADIAEKYDSTVYLLHVVPEGSMPKGLAQWASAEHVPESPTWLYEQSVADNILFAAEDRIRDKGIKKIERLVERGDAAVRILEAARTHAADLIVMGTRGLSDLQGLLMGSVAHKVSHHAPCTVVTVR